METSDTDLLAVGDQVFAREHLDLAGYMGEVISVRLATGDYYVRWEQRGRITTCKWHKAHDLRLLSRIYKEEYEVVRDEPKFEYNTRNNGSAKTDKGKLRWDLLPRFLVKPIAKVLHYGAVKYADHNWMGLDPNSLLAAFDRHMEAHQLALHKMWEQEMPLVSDAVADGMDCYSGIPTTWDLPEGLLFDEESHLPHIDHALTCLVMYRYLLVNGPLNKLPESSRIQQEKLIST